MSPFVNDPDFVLHVGDALDVLAAMPDESVHCVVTSPPYWGLRDYGTEGQLGLEPTPDEYVSSMVAVFREVRRVLRRDGTCWLNIGDSYNANVGAGFNANARIGHQNTVLPSGLPAKNLVGIPWRLAFALQADGWYLRSDVIWSKPNPMPESVSDRPTKAHEYLFLLTKSARYFYDADAIREPAEWARWGNQTNGKHEGSESAAGWIGSKSKEELQRRGPTWEGDGRGRNKRSVWEIATEPYPDAHFATFPQALVEPCVLAGTSERGCCPVCGAPWERETERETVREHGGTRDMTKTPLPVVRAGWRNGGPSSATVGWHPTCLCETLPEGGRGAGPAPSDSVPCAVLDPFMGSGTVAVVARRLGRRAVGIELNPEYALLASKRLQQLSLLAA